MWIIMTIKSHDTMYDSHKTCHHPELSGAVPHIVRNVFYRTSMILTPEAAPNRRHLII